MASFEQASTVKQLLSEGWQIEPAPDKLAFGGPVVMKRVRQDGNIDRVTVEPNGEAVPHG